MTKPFSNVGLKTTLAIAAQQHINNKKKEQVEQLLLKDGRSLVQLPLSDLVSLESGGNYILLRTKGGEEHRYRSTIAKMLNRLSEDDFLQTHRAFIVNLNFVEGFDTNSVTVGGHTVPISKGKRFEVVEALSRLSIN